MSLRIRLNLTDLMKSGFSKEQRKALAPLIGSSALRREFAQRVIDEIVRRTNDGLDKNHSGFAPYSKRYKDSDEFKIYGKSSRVNLKLTGSMQASIGILATSKNAVTIAIPDGPEATRARRHINGSGKLPVRDFWGMSSEDQVAILKSTLRDFNSSDLIEQVQELDLGTTSVLAGEQETSVENTVLNQLSILSESDDG